MGEMGRWGAMVMGFSLERLSKAVNLLTRQHGHRFQAHGNTPREYGNNSRKIA